MAVPRGFEAFGDNREGWAYTVDGVPISEAQGRAYQAEQQALDRRATQLLLSLGLNARATTGDAVQLANRVRSMVLSGADDAEVMQVVNQTRGGPGYDTTYRGGGDRGTVVGTFPSMVAPPLTTPPTAPARVAGEYGADLPSPSGGGGNPPGTASVSDGIAYDASGRSLGPVGADYAAGGQLPGGEVVTNSVTQPTMIGGVLYRPPRPGETEAKSSINDPRGDWVGSPGDTGPTGNPNTPVNPNVGAPAVAPNGVVRQDVINPTLPGGPQGPAPATAFKGGDAANGPAAPPLTTPPATVAAAPRAAPRAGFGIPRIGAAYDPMQDFLGLATAGGKNYADPARSILAAAPPLGDGRSRLSSTGPMTDIGNGGADPYIDPVTGLEIPGPELPPGDDDLPGVPTGRFATMPDGTKVPIQVIDLGNGRTWTGIINPYTGSPQEMGESAAPRPGGGSGRAPTIINMPGGLDATVGKLDAQAAAANAAAANNRARAESGLYDAQTLRVLEEIEQLKLKGPQFAAELAQKQAQFDVLQRSTDAGRAQQQAQFEANLRDTAAQRAQQQGQFDTTSGGYDASGNPTLDRETQAAIQERANLDSLARRAEAAANIALRRGDQVEAQRQFDLVDQLNNKKFALDDKIQSGRLSLDTELGRGNLDISRGRLDLDRAQQAFQQARDPFSATQKAAQLRGAPVAPELGGYAPDPGRETDSTGQYEVLPGGDDMMRQRLYGAPPMGAPRLQRLQPERMGGERRLNPDGTPYNPPYRPPNPNVRSGGPVYQEAGGFMGTSRLGGGAAGIEQPTNQVPAETYPMERPAGGPPPWARAGGRQRGFRDQPTDQTPAMGMHNDRVSPDDLQRQNQQQWRDLGGGVRTPIGGQAAPEGKNPVLDLWKNSRITSEPGSMELKVAPGAPKPPKLQSAQPSRYEGMSAGLRTVFEGGRLGAGRMELPPLSSQDRRSLLPSEARILDAEHLSRGTDPEDAREMERRLTETATPSMGRRTVTRRPAMPALY